MQEDLPILASRQDAQPSGVGGVASSRPVDDYAAQVAKTNAEIAARHAAIQARHGVANRVCGECTACCTVMAVFELNKANHQPCPHNCGKCAIYDVRPKSCRAWSCSWLLGRIEGDERRRPDKLGLVFYFEKLTGKPITVASEVWSGAAKESSNANLLQKMSQRAPIVLRSPTGEFDVVSPDPELRKYILRLIEVEWNQSLYSQYLVTSFQPVQ